MFRTKFITSVVLLGAFCSPVFSQDVNDNFFGDASLIGVKDSLKIEKLSNIKTPFIVRGAKWNRSATLGKDIEFKSQGIWQTMPKGTELFAITFRDGFSDEWKKKIESGESVPNVAWCSPYHDTKKGSSYCFYGGQNGKIMVGSGSYGSHYFPEYMATSFNYFGLKEVPIIEERNSAFEKEFTLEAEIRKISKSSVKYRLYFNDGENRSVVYKGESKREDDGTAVIKLFGGSVRVIPDGKKSFIIESVKPLSNDEKSINEDFRFPYSLYQ